MIFPEIAFNVTNTNLQPSKAGIGRRLNTHKFTEITAQRINKNIIQFVKVCEIIQIIQTGPDTEFIASVLSSGVSGEKIFLTKNQSHDKVKTPWL